MRDEINQKLSDWACTGDGFYYEANFNCMSNYEGLEQVRQYGSEWSLRLKPKVTSAQLSQVIEALDYLTDNVIIDEHELSELTDRAIDEELQEYARENHLPIEPVRGIFFDDFYEYALMSFDCRSMYLDFSAEVEQEFLARVKTTSSNYWTHYYVNEYHFPEFCYICQSETDLPSVEAYSA